MEGRFLCIGIRCDVIDVEGYNGLCFFFVLYDNVLFSEGEGGEVLNCDCYIDMVNIVLVFFFFLDVDRFFSVDIDGFENFNFFLGGGLFFDS